MDAAAVKKMIDDAIRANNSSKWRFDSIRDNLDGMNQAQRNVVKQIVDARVASGGGGYTDAEAIKAVKDALPD